MSGRWSASVSNGGNAQHASQVRVVRSTASSCWIHRQLHGRDRVTLPQIRRQQPDKDPEKKNQQTRTVLDALMSRAKQLGTTTRAKVNLLLSQMPNGRATHPRSEQVGGTCTTPSNLNRLWWEH